jgi:acyl-CoA thioester hydrolase
VTAPHRHRIRVRYAECDMQGVAFNAHYLAWFDHAITELFRAAFGSYEAFVERGIDIVVGEARLRFLTAARFDDELDLEVAVDRIGDTSLTCRHAVRRAGELLVEGETRHVFVDAAALTKVSAPDWVRAGLAPWTSPAQPEPD